MSASEHHSPELDETDPTPPEYDSFKRWFWGKYPEERARGTELDFQKMYRAYQAGYAQRAKDQPQRNSEPGE